MHHSWFFLGAGVILLVMATIAEVFALAVQHHQAGNLHQAEQLYLQILQTDPGQADAHHLLGVLAYQRGRFDLAVKAIGQALALNPGVAAYYSNLGAAQEALGQVAEAAANYQTALRLQPDYAEAHNNLGNVFFGQGKLEQAVTHFQYALRSRADYPEAHHGLGNAFFVQGMLDKAVSHHHHALRSRPDYPEAHNSLANALLTQGKPDEAVVHYQEALRVRPDYPEAHNGLGNALLTQGKPDEAVTHYRHALRTRPNYAEAHNNLGNALLRQDKPEEAIRSCQQALRLKPDFAEAYYNLGNALERQDQLDEVVRCYRQALHFKPDFAEAHSNLGAILLRQGHVDEALTSFRQALRLAPQLTTAQSNLLSALNYDPQADPDTVFAEHCRWGQAQERAKCDVRRATSEEVHLTSHIAHRTSHLGERPLRIGYVSPDLRFHPLTRYLEPVLAHHDPHQVEVYCYAEVRRPDAVTARLQRLVQGWRWTCDQTDDQVAEWIRNDRIDILVDLAGHTAGNRLLVFALKPAPVQVTWLGYMNTTGLTSVDYRLTDDVLDPPAPVRDTEELVRLPGGMCCFAPPSDAPAVAPLPALERRHLTFGSLSSLSKFNGRVFDLWSQVLESVPVSRLLMFHHTLTGTASEHIRRQFTDRGIANERLDLRQGSYGPGYLGVYGEIDVSLDTFPYSGGVTTCESLWMGVPVLSLCGVTRASRNSAAILARVGLNDWVVGTPEQYVALAARLANELDRLAQLRSQLRDRMEPSLCDARRLTRELEKAYRTIWHRFCTRQRQETPNPKPQIPNKSK